MTTVILPKRNTLGVCRGCPLEVGGGALPGAARQVERALAGRGFDVTVRVTAWCDIAGRVRDAGSAVKTGRGPGPA